MTIFNFLHLNMFPVFLLLFDSFSMFYKLHSPCSLSFCMIDCVHFFNFSNFPMFHVFLRFFVFAFLRFSFGRGQTKTPNQSQVCPNLKLVWGWGGRSGELLPSSPSPPTPLNRCRRGACHPTPHYGHRTKFVPALHPDTLRVGQFPTATAVSGTQTETSAIECARPFFAATSVLTLRTMEDVRCSLQGSTDTDVLDPVMDRTTRTKLSTNRRADNPTCEISILAGREKREASLGDHAAVVRQGRFAPPTL